MKEEKKKRNIILAIESDPCFKLPRLSFYITQIHWIIIAFFSLCPYFWRVEAEDIIIFIIIIIVQHTC